MINQQIQNYTIISLLGEGGMANVYLAQHQSLGNNVAVKLLKEEFVQHPNIRKRFLAEARSLAKMNHPNVIKVTDLIDAGDIVAFVMEYIEGQTLEDFLSNSGKLSNTEIENMFSQMILAVEYVHSQGLIHRDIKPSNFMVTKSGQIKLLDFGIAKNTNEGVVDYTKTGLMQQMGTPLYMSPEQVKNTAEVTKQTDIYSLGVVLWQLVMNKKPYDSVEFSLPEIQVSILKEPLPLTHTIWDSTIQQATEKDPIKRSLKINSTSGFLTEIKVNIQLKRKTKFNKNRLFIIIGCFFILVTFVIIYLFSNGSKNPNKLENDLDRNKLKGKVKNLISIEDPRFHNSMKYKELKEDYTLEEYFEYDECLQATVVYDTTQFDLNGNTIYRSYQRINPFGFQSDFDDLEIQKYKNEYDDDKQLISVMRAYFGSDYKSNYKTINKLYYENGFLIQSNKISDGYGNQKFSYDKKGNLISRVSLNKKNIEYFRATYHYNINNLCVKMTYGNGNEGGNELYFYDLANKMVKRIQKYKNTKIEERFNSYGDIVYEKSFNNKTSKGNFIKYKVYFYSYDKNNNWIKKTCKSYYGYNLNSLSSEIENVIKRQIIYF